MDILIDGQTSNVVQLPVAKTISASDQKWGKAVMKLGFSIVPSLLLRAQNRLGLNPTQLAVLMQLCDFWWDNDRKPYPAKKILAERLGISERQVQRYIAELEKAGLVIRTQRYASHGGKLSNTYDLEGLVKKLKDLEPDFRKVEENVKADRVAVTKAGYRHSRKLSSLSK
jgi:predicted transcriptional regulator